MLHHNYKIATGSFTAVRTSNMREEMLFVSLVKSDLILHGPINTNKKFDRYISRTDSKLKFNLNTLSTYRN